MAVHARRHQHRFHLEQDGHSITVVWSTRRGRAEVLVDGKVVAAARTRRTATTELRGETADGEGAVHPFTVRLGRPDIPGDEPLCALETGHRLYLMPLVPLTADEAPPPEPTPPPRDPRVLLTRWYRRHHRRRPR
ncbi:hypothetical protein EF910_26335 [Streptomyces sp. WAC07149]|uniref:hypothetical protein n=1 Tax=Streptomyces sp. WAC07149 TaxID=2487425 RepID=UPI000F774D41|nr:hypothetical protein [Streptomyces sp. WAC07149]RST01858.1 hypothetical protein EF910_26335 [Streptomyces sp. WAC07149]